MAPIADGGVGTPALFDVEGKRARARHLKRVSVEKRAGELLWLRYRPKR